MTYATDRRLDFIDWRLTVHGSIRRQHLMDAFQISQPQASADLTAFEAEHPGAMVYDKSAKQYVPGRNPYRSKRGWTPEAVNAWKQFCATGHPMAWDCNIS